MPGRSEARWGRETSLLQRLDSCSNRAHQPWCGTVPHPSSELVWFARFLRRLSLLGRALLPRQPARSSWSNVVTAAAGFDERVLRSGRHFARGVAPCHTPAAATHQSVPHHARTARSAYVQTAISTGVWYRTTPPLPSALEAGVLASDARYRATSQAASRTVIPEWRGPYSWLNFDQRFPRSTQAFRTGVVPYHTPLQRAHLCTSRHASRARFPTVKNVIR